MNSIGKGHTHYNPLCNFMKTKGVFHLTFLLICIGIFVFKDYLLFKKLYIFLDIANDTYNQAYPYLVNIADNIRDEGIPFWSFYHGMGQNVFPGEITNPFNLILYLLGSEYLPYGIVYVELLKIILAGIIFYYYLKTISLAPFTCITGGVLISFSGYMILGSGWYGHSAFVLFGIFTLFSFEKLYKENKWYYFPLSVALLSSRSPFYVYILGIFLLLYSIFRILGDGRYGIKEACILYLKLAGAGILGLAMVAPFLMNDLLRIMDSPRIGGDAGYFSWLMKGQILSFGDYLHNITVLFRLFSNDILGVGSEFKGWYNYLEAPSFYSGLVTLLILPQVFGFLDKKRKMIFSVFLFIWILVVIFPFIRHALYLFTGDYYKGGASFIILVVLLFFSLHAIDYISRTRRINIPLLFSTLGVLLGILYFPWFPEEMSPIVKEIRIVTASFLVIYTVLLYYCGKVNFITWRFILLAVICCEACMFSFLTVNKRQVLTTEEIKGPIGYYDNTVNVLDAIKETDQDFFRVEKDYFSGKAIYKSLNEAEIQKYYGTSSYNQFNQKYYIRFLTETGIIDGSDEHMTRWAKGLSSRPLLQTLAGVKYYLCKNKPNDFLKANYSPFYISGDVTALQNKYFLPLGFTYDRYISYSEFKKLDTLHKDMVLLKAFVAENGETDFRVFDIFDTENMNEKYSFKKYGEDVNELKHETMKVTEHGQNSIRGTIQVSKIKLLFFAIPYDKGWTITIDGKKTKLKLINIGFMGVIIPPGIHTVELSFAPPFLISGTLVMLLSLSLYLVLVFRKKRKRNNTEWNTE